MADEHGARVAHDHRPRGGGESDSGRVATAPAPPRGAAWRCVLLSAVSVFAVVLYRTAWVSDDAYITFRHIENLVGGFGLGWNVAERVQAFSHPLWMLLMAVLRWTTGEVYLTSMALGAGLTVTAVVLLGWRHAVSAWAVAVACSVLVLSRAFVDYGTSGLENPLSHLLVAVLALIWLDVLPGRRRTLGLGFVAGLLVCTRIDLALIGGPLLVAELIRVRDKGHLFPLTLGLTPVILWYGFSLFYFGSVVPNTAHAKLGAGIPRAEMVTQGLCYFEDSLLRDPITLLGCGLGIVLVLARGSGRMRCFAVGPILYLGYVVWIGGDAMSGRFLTVPLFSSVLLASRILPWRGLLAASLLIAVVAVGLAPANPTVLSGADFGADPEATRWPQRCRILDNRAHFYQRTGLLPVLGAGLLEPMGELVTSGRRVADIGPHVGLKQAIGMFGWAAGPDAHIVDEMALAEPLLARLPSRNRDDWFIAHFRRRIPDGYWETLESGENRIVDLHLAAFYDHLRLVIRGDLWDPKRWGAVADLATGRHRDLLGYAFYDRVNQAFDRLETDDPEGGLHQLRVAAADHPDRAIGWYYVAREAAAQGRFDLAREAISTARRLDPEQVLFAELERSVATALDRSPAIGTPTGS
jgi:arabinofuranosyltransferase